MLIYDIYFLIIRMDINIYFELLVEVFIVELFNFLFFLGYICWKKFNIIFN